MAAPTNHWKLGLFVVTGFVLGMSALVAMGAHSLKKTTVSYRTYFDESVQGLEIGSPVKFRGVTIGTVPDIGLAADHRHVEVDLDLDVDHLNDLQLNIDTSNVAQSTRIAMPPELRAQLGSQGITGVKFVLIDFFNAKDNPVQPLPFPVPENTIPSAQSTMKNLEDSVVKAVDRFPEIADQVSRVLTQMSVMLASLDEKNLGNRVSDAVGQVEQAVRDIREAVKGLQTDRLSAQAQQTMASINLTLVRASALVDRLQSDRGVIANAERATVSLGDLAHGARGLGTELEDTLQDVQDAAAAVKRLGDSLERDPDMLLKGRSQVSR